MCVCVALVIQHAMCVCLVVVCGLPATIFEEKIVIGRKMFFFGVGIMLRYQIS